MIPKKIHFCWLGDAAYSKKTRAYIRSWKKYLPDYEIKCWNLQQFSLDDNVWLKEAFENKKYAFAVDYMRLCALYEEGGVYFDTDVEVRKSFDDLLHLPYFLGQESTPNLVDVGTIGAEPHSPWVAKILEHYKNRHFVRPDGSFDMTPLPQIMRNAFRKNYGLKFIDKPADFNPQDPAMQLLPVEYFSPKRWDTLEVYPTKNTYSIHHFSGSWLPPEPLKKRLKKEIKGKVKSLLGQRCVALIRPAYRKIRALPSLAKEKLLAGFRVFTPVKENCIFFESEGDFCDNARALYEYMIREGYNKKYTFVWKMKHLENFKDKRWPENVVLITETSFREKLRAAFYIGRCRVFFFTHPYWLSHWKRAQTVIDLCHGIPFKGAGGTYIADKYDLAIVQAPFLRQWVAKFHGSKMEQLIISGAPRNDLLFENTGALTKLYGGRHVGEKFILCMNTFKQGLEWTDSKRIDPFVIPDLPDEASLTAFDDFLTAQNVLLVIKIHHLQRTDVLQKVNLSRIKYLEDVDLLSKDIQLYHLVGEADALLTDYSPIFSDYLLLDRPVGFFLNDFKDYSDGRGFITDRPLDYMPGFKIYSQEGLEKFIGNVSCGLDNFSGDRERIRNLFNTYQDKQNCQRIVERFVLN